MEPKKKDILKWIEELRSGKYQQGHGALQTAQGYCCIGVACTLFSPTHLIDVDGKLAGLLPLYSLNDPNWLINIDNHFETITQGVPLSALNDHLRLTFDEIADCLQAVYIEGALDG
jgi:hypothetical protein